MFGQLDTVRHPAEVGLESLLVLAVLMATVIAAIADDIALAPLMTVFAGLQFGKHLPWSQGLQ